MRFIYWFRSSIYTLAVVESKIYNIFKLYKMSTPFSLILSFFLAGFLLLNPSLIYSQAASIHHSDSIIANQLFAEMDTLLKAREWSKAEEKGLQAIRMYREIFGDTCYKIAEIWDRTGTIKYYLSDYSGAIKAWENAVQGFINSPNTSPGDLGKLYNNIGTSYKSLGDYDMSIEYSLKSLEKLRRHYGAEHLNIAAALNNLGLVYDSKGDLNKAEEYFNSAYRLRLKHLQPDDVKIGATYVNLANLYSHRGEYDKSIEYNQKALSIFKIKLKPDHYNIGVVNLNIGSEYYSKGEIDKAIDCGNVALEIFSKHFQKPHPNIAESYANLANCYQEINEFEKSLNYNQKALDIFINVYGEHNVEVAYQYNNIGNLFYTAGKHKDAISYFKKSIDAQLQNNSKNVFKIANTYNNLAKTYMSNQQLDTAVAFYLYALETLGYKKENEYSGMKVGPDLLNSFLSLSKAYKQIYEKSHELKFLHESFVMSTQAVTCLNNMSYSTNYEKTKTFWLDENFDAYKQALCIALLRSQVEKDNNFKIFSFLISEKSRAGLLQSKLCTTEALRYAGIPDSLIEKENQHQINLTWREKQRQSLLDQNIPETDTTVLSISSKIFDLRRQYEALKDTFETRYPEYYRLKYDLSTVSLDYLQDTLLQKGQTLLEYFTGDSAVYIFVLRPDTFQVVEVKKDFPLEDWVKQLRHGLTDYYVKNSRSSTYLETTAREYVSAAYDLYQKLIAPVAGLLTDTLIIVPDGVLGYVPFDVLLSEKPQHPTRFHNHAYLGQARRISYAYSATLLREMRDKKHRLQPTENLLALAPFFRGNAAQLREQLDTLSELLALRRDTLAALPASGREALVVAKIYNGKALLGAESPKEILQQEAGRYRILHLSTHGKADDKVGDYAYLGFALPGDAPAFDKFYAKDIYNLALNADLVTLSACETGIGELKRGEGIISLARAFAYAGAKSIVTTLWSVNDARTGELMERFYKNLHQGMDKDAALWKAKKDFVAAHKKDAAHPYFWAGFIPIGDMRAIRN